MDSLDKKQDLVAEKRRKDMGQETVQESTVNLSEEKSLKGRNLD